jgi:hypothetical protein
VAPPDAFAGSGIEDDKIPKETIDAIERLLRISLREMLLPVFAAKLDEDAVVFDEIEAGANAPVFVNCRMQNVAKERIFIMVFCAFLKRFPSCNYVLLNSNTVGWIS